MASLEGRTQLGGDIMLHGKAKSIGCLAMGDTVAEELFALAAWVGKDNMQVIIAPTDFRQANAQLPENVPNWTNELYTQLKMQLAVYAIK
jgi:murein L,D-transpeptidase YafK